VIILGLLLSILLVARKVSRQQVETIYQDQFRELLETRQIESIEAKGSWINVTLRDGGRKVKVNLPEEYSRAPETINDWLEHGVKLTFPDASMLPAILLNVVPLVLLILVMLYFVNRQMRMASAREGAFPFLKSNVSMAQKESTGVTFEDVAGVDEAKEELEETVEFLRNPEKYQSIGGRIPRGILLVGHPGTGKTLLAKAVAGEATVPFFSLCGSDFVELFVGVGAARVRDLFTKARENQPCIIFLDEIDAVGRKRGAGLGGGHDEREQTLNAILAAMDGFSRDDGIIVMAATNRNDVLDPALLRPGRFDRQIVVDLPDVKGREGILKVHARKVKLDATADLSIVARGTPGCSGADLEALVNEGALLAATRGKTSVGLAELEEARDKIIFGRQKRSRVMSEEDRRITAYHEAGHALLAALHPDVEPLHKVTIIPRGPTLGLTMTLPERDRYNVRRRECLGRLILAMAGRASEELFCDDISAGAKNDIQTATVLARKMVTQWGMSQKIGPVSYSDEEEHIFLGTEISRAKRHGEQISQLIDEEIKSLLDQAYEDAKELCQKHAKELDALAQTLLKLETLTGDEVKLILDGGSSDDIEASRKVEERKREADSETPPEEELPEGPAAGDLPAPAGSPA
jgi:cell division protease FtsH